MPDNDKPDTDDTPTTYSLPHAHAHSILQIRSFTITLKPGAKVRDGVQEFMDTFVDAVNSYMQGYAVDWENATPSNELVEATAQKINTAFQAMMNMEHPLATMFDVVDQLKMLAIKDSLDAAEETGNITNIEELFANVMVVMTDLGSRYNDLNGICIVDHPEGEICSRMVDATE